METGPRKRLRVGVVGGGRISQSAHLPCLAQDDTRFEIAAIADVSPRLSHAVGSRYGCGIVPSVQELLELGVDAIVCAAPIALHKEVVVEALAAGVHVLCEKPVALTLRDCDEMIRARNRAGRAVQVGYMKRFDPAVDTLLALLRDCNEQPRFLAVQVVDPSHRPFTSGLDLIEPDVPGEWRSKLQSLERDQVGEATGLNFPGPAYLAYRHGYAASLVHDVNLMHAMLDALGHRPTLDVAGARYWDGGRAVELSLELDGGGSARLSHVALPDVPLYREECTVCLPDRILELSFPSPFLPRQNAVLVEHRRTSDNTLATTTFSGNGNDPFLLQLRRFHAVVTGAAPPVNTLEDARRDLELLIRAHAAAMATSHDRLRLAAGTEPPAAEANVRVRGAG